MQHIRCDQPSICVPELARLIVIPGMGQQMLSALVAARNLQIEKALVKTNR